MLPWYFADKTMGVFHLQSPRKKYDFTYEQAREACAAEGASLATFQQLSAAQQVRTGAGSIALWMCEWVGDPSSSQTSCLLCLHP